MRRYSVNLTKSTPVVSDVVVVELRTRRPVVLATLVVQRKPAKTIKRGSATHRALDFMMGSAPTSASIIGGAVWRDVKRGRSVPSRGGGDYAAQMLLGRLRKSGWVHVANSDGSSRWAITAAGRHAASYLVRP